MIRAIVIAGNYIEYSDFILSNHLNPREFKYVSFPEDILGLHNIKIIKTGQWRLNPITDNEYFKRLEIENKYGY